jgi:hypothetical protein
MSGLDDKLSAPRREFPPKPPRKNSILPLLVCAATTIIVNLSIYDDLVKHNFRWDYIVGSIGLWLMLLLLIKSVYHYYWS